MTRLYFPYIKWISGPVLILLDRLPVLFPLGYCNVGKLGILFLFLFLFCRLMPIQSGSAGRF